MQRKFASSVFIAILFCATISLAQGKAKTFFEQADHFLAANVHNARVDYRHIHQNPAALNELVKLIATLEFDELSEGDAQKAFWINAYNILVIKGVVEHWPTVSPMNIEGFFEQKKYTVAGQHMTLNSIENDHIRARFKDARIHFALVCAAVGCPALMPAAYLPDKLDQQLAARTYAAVNDNLHVRIDAEQKTVFISEIFKWYREDFLAEKLTILAYINQFRKPPIPADFRIDFIPYNWQLNAFVEPE